MKYFCTSEECHGTCYHEFYKGKWDETTFWKKDSLYLHDDIDYENPAFFDIVTNVIPEYDPFGETELREEQWNEIFTKALKVDGTAKEVAEEINSWMNDTFQEYGLVTILGI